MYEKSSYRTFYAVTKGEGERTEVFFSKEAAMKHCRGRLGGHVEQRVIGELGWLKGIRPDMITRCDSRGYADLMLENGLYIRLYPHEVDAIYLAA